MHPSWTSSLGQLKLLGPHRTVTQKWTSSRSFQNENQKNIFSLFLAVWEVPEFDVKVKKGLHFYGQLHLRTGEAYETTVHLLDNMQLQTVIHLKPLRYGKESKKGNGKPIFKFINLYLHKDNEWPELGPDLVCQGETQFLRGYVFRFKRNLENHHLLISKNIFNSDQQKEPYSRCTETF